MARATQRAIIKYLTDVKDVTIGQINATGMRATGNLAGTVKVKKLDETDGFIQFAPYFKFLIKSKPQGRKAGAWPPVDSIRDWIRAKRIQFGGFNVDQMTFLIGRKIAQRGTDIHLNKRQPIDINKIMQTLYKEHETDIGDGVSIDLLPEVNKIIGRVNRTL